MYQFLNYQTIFFWIDTISESEYTTVIMNDNPWLSFHQLPVTNNYQNTIFEYPVVSADSKLVHFVIDVSSMMLFRGDFYDKVGKCMLDRMEYSAYVWNNCDTLSSVEMRKIKISSNVDIRKQLKHDIIQSMCNLVQRTAINECHTKLLGFGLKNNKLSNEPFMKSCFNIYDVICGFDNLKDKYAQYMKHYYFTQFIVESHFLQNYGISKYNICAKKSIDSHSNNSIINCNSYASKYDFSDDNIGRCGVISLFHINLSHAIYDTKSFTNIINLLMKKRNCIRHMRVSYLMFSNFIVDNIKYTNNIIPLDTEMDVQYASFLRDLSFLSLGIQSFLFINLKNEECDFDNFNKSISNKFIKKEYFKLCKYLIKFVIQYIEPLYLRDNIFKLDANLTLYSHLYLFLSYTLIGSTQYLLKMRQIKRSFDRYYELAIKRQKYILLSNDYVQETMIKGIRLKLSAQSKSKMTKNSTIDRLSFFVNQIKTIRKLLYFDEKEKESMSDLFKPRLGIDTINIIKYVLNQDTRNKKCFKKWKLILSNNQFNTNKNYNVIQCNFCEKKNISRVLDHKELMKKCKKCQKVYYCDKKCQKKDWKINNHFMVCC